MSTTGGAGATILPRANGRFGSLAWVVLNVVGVMVPAGAALVSYYDVWASPPATS
ncbi:ATP-binding cassette, subfamily B [Streptomyces sp. di188]|nr:ATP-binding cassette, subfamily B [Streptomyces sp. di50b]SCE21779.1 ATP-binding cassette, subfamily B [Streptomyces sp. di188]